jgi:enamine deaminase RidA (YjgF/YER057c/UK114 family)
MSEWTRINSPELPELPVFAHAAIAGDHIHLSGMLGLTDDFSGVVEGGIGPETTLGEWDAMNAAYLPAFGARTPARIAVGCAALLFGARVELDCVAYRP